MDFEVLQTLSSFKQVTLQSVTQINRKETSLFLRCWIWRWMCLKTQRASQQLDDYEQQSQDGLAGHSQLWIEFSQVTRRSEMTVEFWENGSPLQKIICKIYSNEIHLIGVKDLMDLEPALPKAQTRRALRRSLSCHGGEETLISPTVSIFNQHWINKNNSEGQGRRWGSYHSQSSMTFTNKPRLKKQLCKKGCIRNSSTIARLRGRAAQTSRP